MEHQLNKFWPWLVLLVVNAAVLTFNAVLVRFGHHALPFLVLLLLVCGNAVFIARHRPSASRSLKWGQRCARIVGIGYMVAAPLHMSIEGPPVWIRVLCMVFQGYMGYLFLTVLGGRTDQVKGER